MRPRRTLMHENGRLAVLGSRFSVLFRVRRLLMSLARERAAAIGQETQRILAAGHYTTPAGTLVDLSAPLAQTKAGTRSYPPEAMLPAEIGGAHATTIGVTNEPTLV